MSEDTNLSGQVALVTGGGRGIGRALALGLAAAGAAVAVSARTEAQLAETVDLITKSGGRAAVSDRVAVEEMVTGVEDELGPIDLLVNNAGVPGAPGRDWEADPDRWWRVIEINVRGPFLCSWAVVPGMIKRRRGRIVNISSSSAYQSNPYLSSYPASKAALTNMSRSLADATREYGVSVFAYCPGLVRTEMTDFMEGSPELPEVATATIRKAFQTGFSVPPETSAEGLLFLASGKADALSGRHLDVRWGLEEIAARADEIEQKDLYVLTLPR